MFTASGLQIRAIAALTKACDSLLMSRRSSKVPIFALSPNEGTRRKVTCLEGSIRWSWEGVNDPEIILNLAEDELLKRGVVRNVIS